MQKTPWYIRSLAVMYQITPEKFVHKMMRQCGMRHPRNMRNRFTKAYVCYDNEHGFGIMISAHRSKQVRQAIVVQLELVEITEVPRLHMPTAKKIHTNGIIESRLIYFDEFALVKEVFKMYKKTIMEYIEYCGDPKLFSLLDANSTLE